MSDWLAQIFEMQAELQQKIRDKQGAPPIDEQSITERIESIKGNVLALEHELHELLDETKWKDWTVGEPFINRDQAVKESVDVLCFFLNILLHLAVTPSELFERYLAKNIVNNQRQDDDYDGVSTKCPGCGRALEDVMINKAHRANGSVMLYWCTCGQALRPEVAMSFVKD
jgi:dimeric dUTPase (all-alpha-NTP-PPase superfamily)